MDRPRHLIVTLAAIVAGCAQAPRPDELSPIDTTVCQIVNEPERFANRTVRFAAEFKADMHFALLVAQNCTGGIALVSPSDPQIVAPLTDAVWQGCIGTIDKQIFGTWIGIFRWDPKAVPGTGRLPRTLELQKIEDFKADLSQLRCRP